MDILKYIDDTIQTYSPEEIKNFNKGGSVTTPKRGLVDGPGSYAGEELSIIEEYKKLVNEDLLKGDLSKTPSFSNFLNKKYPNESRNIQYLAKKTGFDSRVFFQNKKLELAQKLVTENNLALKYDPDGKKGILRKLGGEGVRTGQSGYTEQLYNILDTMDTADDKVVKALDVIIEQDLPLKSIKDAAQYKQSRGILNQMIYEISGVGADKLKDRLKNSKYYTKDFQDTIDYINRIGKSHQDFEGIKFSEAFEFGKTRLAGAAQLEGRNLLSFYKDPNTNITNYAFKHWDRTNFNNQPSRVKLYDKKKIIRKSDGTLVPKKGLSLEDAELKWKAGMKVKAKDLIFSYDGSELFDSTTLRTRGRASGLFNEVYDATRDYYNTYRKSVPDPKNPGKNIEFGKLMERDFGKNALAIGHNAPGGIKAAPFTNFQIQTQQMNTALYYATKNIKNKELQKRVIENIYGDLKGLTSEEYLKEFLKQPPVTSYRQAVYDVEIKNLKTVKAKDELKNVIKKLGYKCAKSGGGEEDLACYMKDVMQTKEDLKSNDPLIRAKALTKQRKAANAAKKIPELFSLFRKGLQGTLGTIGGPAGAVVEGLIEAGTYDYFRRKGYTHKQASAETFFGKIFGLGDLKKEEGRSPFEDATKLLEKEIAGKDPAKLRYLDNLKKQEEIYNEIASLEAASSGEQYLKPEQSENLKNKLELKLTELKKLENKIKPGSPDYEAWKEAEERQQNKAGIRAEEYKKESRLFPETEEESEKRMSILNAPKRLQEQRKYLTGTIEPGAERIPSMLQFEPGELDEMAGDLDKWGLIYDARIGGLDLLDKIGIAGGVSKMASGGIASLTTTIPPKRGPNHQGLASLKKYGKQY